MDTNISIIQLIKDGVISVDLEISNIAAQKEVNIYVRQYLNKSPDYLVISNKIKAIEMDLAKAAPSEKTFLYDQRSHWQQVEKDFIINALLLARLFSKIEVRSARLKEALRLFEEGKIKAADQTLPAKDLLNDQFHLLVYVSYQQAKLKLLKEGY